MTEDRVRIAPIAAEQQPEAIRLLFSHLSSVECATLASTLTGGDAQVAGLLGAWRDGQLVGAAWGQLQPGRTAIVWPPGLADGEPEATSARLLEIVVAALAEADVQMTQALLPTLAHPHARRLTGAGFTHLADLLYLMSVSDVFPTSRPAGRLHFEPWRPAAEDRLAALVEATYEGTLDCPRLNGRRSMADVLAGYRATGVHHPEHWLFVQHAGRDVGCLILADHPGVEQMELVYMGLIPEARGRGFGQEIARQAQWLALQAGRRRLVLAVDAGNDPAIGMYTAVGFHPWEQRSVLVKFLEKSC